MTPPRGPLPRSAFRGLLLGGAVGDALGAPVEFLDLAEIRRRHGPSGVRGLVEDGGRAGAITDDTQMTLFTAEALLRGGGDARRVQAEARGAYLRWLHTQGEAVPADVLDGWLVAVPGLHARRAPGGTCLSALSAGGHGTRERPANDSKGCGGVMRVAPVGLVMGDGAFDCACDLAAITHGHPTGQLASGYLAELVRRLSVRPGPSPREAAEASLARLEQEEGHEETSSAVREALRLAGEGVPRPERLEALGGGWVAEEALAIALACALAAPTFAEGVLLAVNHGGDSDSTGAIAGNLLGLVHGEEGIPRPWLERLELREVIAQMADALWEHLGQGRAAGSHG